MAKNVLSGTDLVHGDHEVSYYKGTGGAVAPPISVSTSESFERLLSVSGNTL
jgi:hypothetical protein